LVNQAARKLGDMEFEWDEAKDARNRAKHGLSLAMAVRLDWASGQVEEDIRADYGEVRIQLLAKLDGRVHLCVYTVRDGKNRVISLRKANRREIMKYEQRR
jgi:uncharacterized protein